jgi:hypothetical protein
VSAVTRHIGRNHGGKESDEEGQAGEEEDSEQAHLEEEEVARSPDSSLA